MLHIQARTPVSNLPIKRVMSKLFQSFIYSHLPQKEHQGYAHPNGKVFKSSVFQIHYDRNTISIDFRSLEKEYEQDLAMAILKHGLKLGEVHLSETTVQLTQESDPDSVMNAQGFVCAAIKNDLTKKKIFLEPGDYRHTQIITTNALQKYEALFGEPYEGDLRITPLWQSFKPHTFWYEKTPYTAWKARYKIEATPKMLRLIRDTGLGSGTMKNLGFLELTDG